ncbi:MAG: peptidylprolyl isomerase [Vicinamibacterales bacterium]
MLFPLHTRCLWRHSLLLVGFAFLATVTAAAAQQRAAPRPAPRRPAPPPVAPAGPFKTSLTAADMANKQAVVETSAGTFVMTLLAEAAPNHVGYFMKLAEEGAFAGTTFHRAVRMGIVQGGDPLSKDPARRALYGTGGLGVLDRENNQERHTRGAVSAVLQPGRPNSAGSQFFVCVTDQPALDGQYTVFGRVVDGIDVVERISASPTDADGRVVDRIEITKVTIRDTPPPEPDPFSTETVQQLSTFRAVLETSAGDLVVELLPDRAPDHVRNFLRLAQTGVYDDMTFHRVVKGFAAQTGSLTTRTTPLTDKQRRFVTMLQPEFNDTKHERGIVSMARGDDPASASTSFFVCFAPAPSLDGKYTVFGRLTSGLDVLAAIEALPVDGETPQAPLLLKRVRVERITP